MINLSIFTNEITANLDLLFGACVVDQSVWITISRKVIAEEPDLSNGVHLPVST